MSSYQVVLFDLDGTLTDPKLGITKSVQFALAKFGIKIDNLDLLIPFIGPPLAESFERFYGFDSEKSWQAVQFYREYFAETGIFENAVYPGVPEFLAQLQQNRKKLILATSKPTVFAERIVQHFGLGRFFDSIVGSNMDGSRVAKTEVIREALRLAFITEPGQAVMVGDREHDIIGARNNGIHSIAVAYGYGSRDELIQAGPNFVVDTVNELDQLLNL